jgi:zinc transporter ZupT
MSTTTPHRCRFLHWAVAIGGFGVGPAPAAAHGAPQAGGRGVDLPVIIAIAGGIGLFAGLLAVASRNRFSLHTRPDLLSRVVGVLLVGIGTSATISVVQDELSVAIAGVALGVTTGGSVAARFECGLCADVAVGVIAIHRFFEGAVVAALSTAGSSVGTLGVFVLTVHTVLECIVIGSQPTRSRTMAVGAVAAVSGVFVVGNLVGTVGITVIDSSLRLPTTAITGGLLISFGVSEFRSSPVIGQLSSVSL